MKKIMLLLATLVVTIPSHLQTGKIASGFQKVRVTWNKKKIKKSKEIVKRGREEAVKLLKNLNKYIENNMATIIDERFIKINNLFSQIDTSFSVIDKTKLETLLQYTIYFNDTYDQQSKLIRIANKYLTNFSPKCYKSPARREIDRMKYSIQAFIEWMEYQER